MALHIPTKFRACNIHCKEIKKIFSFSPGNRLDHNEQIMFPVLQNLSSVKNIHIGHYYLINLNLKTGRFEVMDSMRREADQCLQEDYIKIVASIKYLWETDYKESRIQIKKT